MSFFPSSQALGDLELDEVFFEYEGPKLFSAKNATGQRYIAVNVAEEECGDGTGAILFVYVPVSVDRFLAVRSGLIPLYSALMDAEADVYLVRSEYPSGHHAVSRLAPHELNDDWLPERDATLSIPSHTQPTFDPVGLGEQATTQMRPLVAVALDRLDLMRTEYPVSDLTDLLRDMQEAVHAIAAEEEGKATTAGAIPDAIVQDSTLALVGVGASSFVAVLAPALGERITAMPLAQRATDRLLSLVAATPDEAALREAAAGLEQRALSKFRSLLQSLADTRTSLRLYLANPGERVRETHLSFDEAGFGLGVLQEVSRTTTFLTISRAILVGANTRTRAFELRDDETSERYAGKIERDALEQVDGLQLGETFRYSARLAVEESYTSWHGVPKVAYRLQAIRRAGDPQA